MVLFHRHVESLATAVVTYPSLEYSFAFRGRSNFTLFTRQKDILFTNYRHLFQCYESSRNKRTGFIIKLNTLLDTG